MTQGKGLFLLGLKREIVTESVVDTGKRKLDCILFRMRLGHVQLNEYLFKIGRADTNQCSYCGDVETIEHFLIDCDQYNNERLQLFIKVSRILGYPPTLSVKLLLGGGDFPIGKNRMLTCALGSYIQDTRRFV